MKNPNHLSPARLSRTKGKAALGSIVEYCDRVLRIAEIKDYEGAFNGLQVQNKGVITRVAAAVDASIATARLAIEAGANLLVVHHGLFWGTRQPWTGSNYELCRYLIENDLAVYSAHLPLDSHPKLGNNAQLCRALGFRTLQPFFFTKEQYLGFRTRMPITRAELSQRLLRAVRSKVAVIPGGEEICRTIGVVTGGAGSEIKLAAKEGVDTFITGEGPHWTYTLAEELHINVFYAGHYATETFGVKALAGEISRHFKIPWTFVDHPTGL